MVHVILVAVVFETIFERPSLKIMVFGFEKLRQNLKFTYINVDVEIVKQFNYLGVIFTKTCNFDVTKKRLADKALKAMYEDI